MRFLDGIDFGSIRVHEGGKVDLLGEGNPGPTVDVTVHSGRLWSRMLRGSTGMAESYILGEWDCDDLVGLATLAGHNLDRLDRVRRPLHPVIGPVQRLGLTMPRTTRSRGQEPDRGPLRPRQRSLLAVPRSVDELLLGRLLRPRG